MTHEQRLSYNEMSVSWSIAWLRASTHPLIHRGRLQWPVIEESSHHVILLDSSVQCSEVKCRVLWFLAVQ